MITISNLSASYHSDKELVPAITDISCSIDTGTTCAVIGPSGSGKSTFLRCIAGLQKNGYSGKITFNGKTVDPREINIGFMPQRFGLLPWKTVKENIELGCKIKNIPLDSRRKTEEILVNELGLQDKLERYPIQLSGGEQQRVGLARVFLLRPDVLLMDEPFSALDVITRESIQKVFFSLWKDASVTTVFVTHFIEEAVFLGQQIIVFSKHPGKILSTIQNPFFGRKDKVQSEEYLKFVYNLRLLLEKELNE